MNLLKPTVKRVDTLGLGGTTNDQQRPSKMWGCHDTKSVTKKLNSNSSFVSQKEVWDKQRDRLTVDIIGTHIPPEENRSLQLESLLNYLINFGPNTVTAVTENLQITVTKR